MKIQTLFPAIISLLFSLSFSCVNGQSIAVGHVSAEIVESLEASYAVSTNLEITSNVNESSILSNNIAQIDLGSVSINSGHEVTCNLSVTPTIVTNSKGNNFTLETLASFNGKQETKRIDGSQRIELGGLARLDPDQAAGVYQGSYSLVFAYN